MDVTSILNGNWEFRVEHKGIKIYSSRVAAQIFMASRENLSYMYL